MASAWPEVTAARRGKRRELTLHGAEINERIDEAGLDENIFKLHLSYLDISKTSLSTLSDSIGKLTDLMRLSLCNNRLTTIPSSVGQLSKLKLLDLSNNQIETLPDEVSNLTCLETLNVSVNKLTCIPSVGNLPALIEFDASYNELSELPEGISQNHDYLTQIRVNHNKISVLPDDLSNLPRLSTLDVADNKLTDIPLRLCECQKLKEFSAKGNCIGDRKLAKMAEQGHLKVLMNHLTTELQKEGKSGKKSKSKKKKKGGKDSQEEDVEELSKDMIEVLHFPSKTDEGLIVTLEVPVLTIRPHILCCIVRHVNLQTSSNMLKHFITLQTKLHDNICQKRQAATIATHDLKFIARPLTYTAAFPQLLKITPLFKHKEITAEKLMSELMEEAEALRKEKKRNTISGIHKYLELLKHKKQYPCVVDGSGAVVSFPPITNSDKTKLSAETTDILIEVTSSTSLDVCKNVMEELLKEMLVLGIGSSSKTSDGGAAASKPDSEEELEASAAKTKNVLVVEQVKIVNQEKELKVVYPSRTDLNSDSFTVIRSYD